MKRFTKTLLLGGCLSGVLLLGACSNTDSSTDSSIATIDGVEISSGDLIESVEKSIGEENMKRIFLYKYLHSKYKVTDLEIEERLSLFDTSYGGEGAGVEYLKQYYGYSDERIFEIFKEEILVEKGLKEYKNLSDKTIEETFNKDGNNITRKVTEIHITSAESGSEKLVSKYNDLLKEGKSVEEIKKLVTESEAVDVTEGEYTNFDLTDVNSKLNQSKKGDIVQIDNTESYGVISLFLVVDTKETKFDDVKSKITQSLLYSDENYEGWLYNEIIKNKEVKISNKNFNYVKEEFIFEVQGLTGTETGTETDAKVEVEAEEESKDNNK